MRRLVAYRWLRGLDLNLRSYVGTNWTVGSARRSGWCYGDGVGRRRRGDRVPAAQRRPTLLRLCRDCQRVVIATTTKLLNTKLKAHPRTCRLVGRSTVSLGPP